MATKPLSFAAALAAPSAPVATNAIPTGSWTLYYHEPEDKSEILTYKNLCSVGSWEELGSVLRELGPHKLTNGLLRIMKGTCSPMWEDKVNIRGGSYCLKIPRRSAIDVFQKYVAAAALGLCAKDGLNKIVGVTISPKKGFCIIKIWNLNAATYNSPSDLLILHDDVKEEEILYRPHTEQRM